MTETKYSGDPCGMDGPCCADPSVGDGEHDCTGECEDICEDSYELVCSNCGGSCYHDL